MTNHPTSIWASRGELFLGSGPSRRVDPGTGPGRYRRALEALKEAGADFAMASFTFDVDEPGSVVVIPERLEKVSQADLEPGNGPPGGTIISDGHGAWRSGIDGALHAISAEVVEKVVLTRQVDVQFNSEVDIRGVVARLLETETHSFTFAVDGLVGASPELLVSLREGMVESLALAGTALETSDLATEKMDLEHALSRASVEEGLSPHVDHLSSEEPTILRFGRINHLATHFSGDVTKGTTVLDVLATLHPTAAVAGTPKDTALKTIKEMEIRSRGRYAGPVGWFDAKGEGEFAIALRCGLVQGLSATLYAGGGIVRGSDAESEFAETEIKLSPMLQALGLA